ncbi:MAG: Steroid C27-monooxygenase [Frankiales bacterium]|nr:Steroid C27-monooxygenase [Frankiales bacterium]
MTAPADDRPRCPVDHLDLLDPDTFADGPPREAFRQVREAQPVYWFPQQDAHHGGFWVVSLLEDVREVSRQPEVFSSAERGAIFTGKSALDEEVMIASTGLLMLNMDPPQHSAQRRVVQRAFTPRVIRDLEVRLVDIAHEIVDRALEKGSGDFVRDIAAELPLLAICELIGIPAEDRQKIFDWTNRLIGFDDPELSSSQEDGELAMLEMYVYANELALLRQAEPQDDIISLLLQADFDGEKLTPDEFNTFFLLLCVAGNETTRNAIAHGMRAFFENPSQWELFKQTRPATAVDEIIRWATPVIEFQRTALSDYVLNGQQIRKGERVVLYYSSANHDSMAISDPEVFDITRADNEHVAFGGGGPHYCLGVQLARAEVRIIFDVIADRLPNIAPTAPASTLRSAFLDGIKALPVRYA